MSAQKTYTGAITGAVMMVYLLNNSKEKKKLYLYRSIVGNIFVLLQSIL